MDEIKISVIVPIYNVDKYLEKCINSILNQSLKEIEIILINDGSIDNSHNICKSFEKNDKRIIYINKKNEGCSKTRNLGIFLSRGRYISFIDADDFIENEMYEKMLKRIENENTDICICGITKEDENGKKIYIKIPKKYKKIEDCYLDNSIFGFPVNKLYKTDIIKKNKIYFPEKIHMSEDLVFNFMYFYYVNDISIEFKEYYHYIYHLNSASNKKVKYYERFDALDTILEFIKKNHLWNKYKKIIENLLNSTLIEVNYSLLEEMKLKKDSYYLTYLKIVKKTEKKYLKKMNIKNKIFLIKRKLRLRFVFLKPFLKKIKKGNNRNE